MQNELATDFTELTEATNAERHWWHGEQTQAHAMYSLISYINSRWNYISGPNATLILGLKSFIVEQ